MVSPPSVALSRKAGPVPSKSDDLGHDALGGDPFRNAVASWLAGCLQATILLPINTTQTHMQTKGTNAQQTMRNIFDNGAINGVRRLYRALGPTVAMLGARQGLKFGSGATIKQKLPPYLPEVVRDALSGGASAFCATTLLFPLDALKTRWQVDLGYPSLRQMYQGLLPAVTYSSCGMALWVVSRNALERNIPEPPSGSHLTPWKHFLCGGLAGMLVQIPFFPFDTLKKRLQASDKPRTMFAEARVLMANGGLHRFYRGFAIKCAFTALNGAIFNTVYVYVRSVLALKLAS